MALWREIQKETFTSLEKLGKFVNLSFKDEAPKHFPLNLPKRLAEKIEKGNPNDPILLQFIPSKDELVTTDGFTIDPVGDAASQKSASLLHKYHGRALLITTAACAMNCRYCFRQNFPYQKASFEKELELIRNNNSIHEVILSGGDPLSLSDRVLGELLKELDTIAHVKIIRFHTRFIIGIPERITEELLNTLSSLRAQVVFVLHLNHPNELDSDIVSALNKLSCLGIPLLSQSVLLKGVNDSALVLKQLCLFLIESGVIPYYLHQLDKVVGASRFHVPIEKGKELIKTLRKELPGYAVPRYVQEIAGETSKSLLIG